MNRLRCSHPHRRLRLSPSLPRQAADCSSSRFSHGASIGHVHVATPVTSCMAPHPDRHNSRARACDPCLAGLMHADQQRLRTQQHAAASCSAAAEMMPARVGMAASSGPELEAATAIPVCLQELRVKDFALVAEDVICFSPGLNVITGESGSGKSVLVEALNLITGATAPSECVRAPAGCAVIEGRYLLSPAAAAAVRAVLQACGMPERALPAAGQAGTLVIKREIVQAAGTGTSGSSSTRSRCFVNNSATSLRVLRDVGNLLVDANVQNSALALREASTQLQLLDRVAGTSELAAHVRHLAGQARQLESSLSELDELADADERARIQALCDAVRRMRVEPNEELRLRQALKNMESRRASVEQCASIRAAVVGELEGFPSRSAPILLRSLGSPPCSPPLLPVLSVLSGEPGSGGGGIVKALRALEVQLSVIMKQEQQITAGEREQEQSDDSEEDEHGEGDEEDEDEEGEGSSRAASSVAAAIAALSLAREQLGEAEGHVRAYARSFQFDVAGHQALGDRLKAIEKLMRAQGCRSTAQLLQAAGEGSKRLRAFFEAEEHQEEWERKLELVAEQLQSLVVELSRRRRLAAARMRASVEGTLWELAMASSRFSVEVEWRTSDVELPASRGVFITDEVEAELRAIGLVAQGEGSVALCGQLPPGPAAARAEVPARGIEEPGPSAGTGSLAGRWYLYAPAGDGSGGGLDHVDFRLAAGPGEPMRPLSSVASGGESARIMLALKAAPQSSLPDGAGIEDAAEALVASGSGACTPVLILDELDSSIGARLGSVIGDILRRMSSPPRPANGQIICVTHLPQVACYADQHVRVRKTTDGDGRITTVFQPLLTPEERVQEISAMLGLEENIAADMLRQAQRRASRAVIDTKAMWEI